MRKRFVIAYVVAVLLLVGTVGAALATESRTPDELAEPLESIGSQIEGWTLVQTATLRSGQLSSLRPTSYIARTYSKNGSVLNLFIAWYALQKAGETMHSPKNCLPAAGWEIEQSGIEDLTVNGRAFPINRTSIRNAGSRMTALYWYQSRNRVLANEYAGKLLLIRDALREGRTGGALVRITLSGSDSSAEALPFAAGILAEVQRCLGR